MKRQDEENALVVVVVSSITEQIVSIRIFLLILVHLVLLLHCSAIRTLRLHRRRLTPVSSDWRGNRKFEPEDVGVVRVRNNLSRIVTGYRVLTSLDGLWCAGWIELGRDTLAVLICFGRVGREGVDAVGFESSCSIEVGVACFVHRCRESERGEEEGGDEGEAVRGGSGTRELGRGWRGGWCRSKDCSGCWTRAARGWSGGKQRER